jgi:hypothetical protein
VVERASYRDSFSMKLPVLFYLLLSVEAVTMIVGGFRYRILPRPLRILEWLIITYLLATVFQWTLASFHIHNLWTMHFNTMIEFIFIFMIYSAWIKQPRARRILLTSYIVFLFVWIASKFSFEPLSLADDGTATISKILQVAFSVYLLVDIVKENDIVWTQDARLWVVVGIILYAAGSLFWFALYNKMLQESPDRLIELYSLNWILIIISNLFFLRAFLCKK